MCFLIPCSRVVMLKLMKRTNAFPQFKRQKTKKSLQIEQDKKNILSIVYGQGKCINYNQHSGKVTSAYKIHATAWQEILPKSLHSMELA